jgi:hypothetical protein
VYIFSRLSCSSSISHQRGNGPDIYIYLQCSGSSATYSPQLGKTVQCSYMVCRSPFYLRHLWEWKVKASGPTARGLTLRGWRPDPKMKIGMANPISGSRGGFQGTDTPHPTPDSFFTVNLSQAEQEWHEHDQYEIFWAPAWSLRKTVKNHRLDKTG